MRQHCPLTDYRAYSVQRLTDSGGEIHPAAGDRAQILTGDPKEVILVESWSRTTRNCSSRSSPATPVEGPSARLCGISKCGTPVRMVCPAVCASQMHPDGRPLAFTSDMPRARLSVQADE